MSFDYEKARAKMDDSHGNSWVAYSDLFMMLSTVFLLLYVSVSLRTQTSGVAVEQKMRMLTEKNADLEQQIQVYNTLRDDHLKNEAPEKEQEVYEKLMGKLSLLQDQAQDEKNKLRRQAKENEEKEYALNEYQRLIRNIINTNVLSKVQLKRRDQIIAKKDTITQEQKSVIESQEGQISNLNEEVARRESEISENKKRIEQANRQLQKQIAAIREQQEEAEITKKEMDQRIAALRSKSQQVISTLEKKNQDALSELTQIQKDNQAKTAELAETRSKMDQMKDQFAEREEKLKENFENALGKERLSAAEKAKRLGEFEKAAKAREAALNNQLSAMAGKAQTAEAEKERAMASVEGLQKDLKAAQELANARSNLAKNIQSELRKAGLSGTVDAKTGDVTLSFGEEYFDTGSASLKPSMMATLQKFMPGYSKSLFKDGKISQKIENVEIIGFASSTYRGRYVPPDSLKQEDREAINYNMKLSTNRADAIFRHIFDTKKMTFEHQRDLLPKIKVVGRGYLPDGKTGNDFPKAMSQEEFCQKYNCKASQKVIIKFKLKD